MCVSWVRGGGGCQGEVGRGKQSKESLQFFLTLYNQEFYYILKTNK